MRETLAPLWMHSIVIEVKQTGTRPDMKSSCTDRTHPGPHSWDVVLLTLVQMLRYWNPLCYMLGINLRDVHEYEAIGYVLGRASRLPAYQLLLAKKLLAPTPFGQAQTVPTLSHKQLQPWFN